MVMFVVFHFTLTDDKVGVNFSVQMFSEVAHQEQDICHRETPTKKPLGKQKCTPTVTLLF